MKILINSVSSRIIFELGKNAKFSLYIKVLLYVMSKFRLQVINKSIEIDTTVEKMLFN